MVAKQKQFLVWAFLALALGFLFHGIKLMLSVRTVESSISVSQIVEQLKNQGLAATNRVRACYMLAQRREAAQEAVPALMEAVRDPSFGVRNTAVLALGSIGPGAAEACPLLIEALRNWKTGGSPQGLSESYLTGSLTLSPEANRSRNIMIWRDGLTTALAAISAGHPDCLTRVSDLLEDRRKEIVLAACNVLSRSATNSVSSEAKLIQLVRSRDLDLRVGALWALGQTKPPSPAVFTILEGALADHEPGVRECAVDLLGQMGNLGAPAVASIVEAMNKSKEEKIDSKYLLTALNPPLSWGERKKTNPEWEYTMPRGPANQGNLWPSHIRYKALAALTAIGLSAKEAAPAVLEIAKDGSDLLRFHAAVTALRLGATCDEVVAPLIQGLAEDIEDTRRVALEEIKKIARDCPAAVLGIARGLDDQKLSIRAAAVQSLAELGTNALSVLPALERATHDPKFAVRQAAVQLVRKLHDTAPLP